MKRKVSGVLAAMLAVLLFTGCGGGKKEDTRQRVPTIGIVITNNVDMIFDELYIYPQQDEPNKNEEMGQDFIQNTSKQIRTGSFGATVERSSRYEVLMRDRDGGVYKFSSVSFSNADHGVIQFDEENGNDDTLVMIIYHTSGAPDTITGEYVYPGDAPDHPHNRLKKQVEFKFKATNNTGETVTKITMREAGDPDKGEVELYLKSLEDGKSETISEKLYEDDQDIRDWLLYIETEDGTSYVSEAPFNPWDISMLEFALDEDGKLVLDAY